MSNDMKHTATATAGYGAVRFESDRDTALALLALLSTFDSDGTVSILSCPSKSGSKYRIDLLLQSQWREATVHKRSGVHKPPRTMDRPIPIRVLGNEHATDRYERSIRYEEDLT